MPRVVFARAITRFPPPPPQPAANYYPFLLLRKRIRPSENPQRAPRRRGSFTRSQRRHCGCVNFWADVKQNSPPVCVYINHIYNYIKSFRFYIIIDYTHDVGNSVVKACECTRASAIPRLNNPQWDYIFIIFHSGIAIPFHSARCFQVTPFRADSSRKNCAVLYVHLDLHAFYTPPREFCSGLQCFGIVGKCQKIWHQRIVSKTLGDSVPNLYRNFYNT